MDKQKEMLTKCEGQKQNACRVGKLAREKTKAQQGEHSWAETGYTLGLQVPSSGALS